MSRKPCGVSTVTLALAARKSIPKEWALTSRWLMTSCSGYWKSVGLTSDKDDLAQSNRAICVRLKCCAIDFRRIDPLTGKEKGVGRAQIGSKSQAETRNIFLAVRCSERPREIQHRAGRYARLHESVVIRACILRSHDKGGKTFIAIAEAIGLIARNKNIAISGLCLARFALANRKELKKAVVPEEDANILGTERMLSNWRDDKAQLLQSCSRDIEFSGRQDQ